MTDYKFVIYNPRGQPVDTLPIIFGFSNVIGGKDGICYAMAQDGSVLGSHWCTKESFLLGDLGLIEGTREDRHKESYQLHYPNGYRMVFIPHHNVTIDSGLREAFRLNEQSFSVHK